MTFPQLRLRRLRASNAIRDLLQETRIHPSDLIQPYFIHDGDDITAIQALPNQYRLSIKNACERSLSFYRSGGRAVILFPVIDPRDKDLNATTALRCDNLHARAVRAVKDIVPQLTVIADVALDPYTTHGHDGILNDSGDVDNDQTLLALQQQALILAKSGADIISPSDMMDGRIGAIRDILDNNGFGNVAILSYAAKFASNLYAPFRDAVGSSGVLRGDKKTYQLNPANIAEAMRETQLDINENADIIMVKPATLYLDIIKSISINNPNIPLFCYHVSGEYSMLHLFSKQTAIPFMQLYDEALIAMKRAGARAIITYGADEWIKHYNQS